jgi:hypothetical protein
VELNRKNTVLIMGQKYVAKKPSERERGPGHSTKYGGEHPKVSVCGRIGGEGL